MERRMENCTPISHLAKAGVTKMDCLFQSALTVGS